MLARCQPALNAMIFVRNIKKFNFDMRPALALFPDFNFVPNIHALVSGIKTPAMLRFSKTAIVRRMGHRFLSSTVAQIVPGKIE
jgi:hypothetical protein